MLFAIGRRSRNLKDVHTLLFILLASGFYLVGFKGKLATPFGKVLIGNREKVKAAAYGAFKTQFCYLRDMKRILNGKASFPIVVDVGANIGDFTLAIAGHSGKVLAVEPCVANFASLMSNIALNQARNVVALNIAAHDQNETLMLDGEGSAIRVVDFDKGQRAQGVPMDQVFDQLQSIDVLKIDVQGHEEKALLGMAQTLAKKRVNLVIVEVHVGWGLPTRNIASLMNSYGYDLALADDYLFNQPHLYFLPGNGHAEREASHKLASPVN